MRVPPDTPSEVFRQLMRRPITPKDYMPKGFLQEDDISSYMVTCYATHAKDEPIKENLDIFKKISTSSDNHEKLDHGDGGLMAEVPVNLGLSDLFLLLEGARLAVTHVLTNPTQCKEELSLNNKEEKFVSCMTTITFIDEDLQLRSPPHNRPLYVTGYVR